MKQAGFKAPARDLCQASQRDYWPTADQQWHPGARGKPKPDPFPDDRRCQAARRGEMVAARESRYGSFLAPGPYG